MGSGKAIAAPIAAPAAASLARSVLMAPLPSSYICLDASVTPSINVALPRLILTLLMFNRFALLDTVWLPTSTIWPAEFFALLIKSFKMCSLGEWAAVGGGFDYSMLLHSEAGLARILPFD